MKCKVVKVLFCGICPYSYVARVDEMQKSHFKCSLTLMEINHPGYIPEWCTLEDAQCLNQETFANAAEYVNPLAMSEAACI